MIRVTVELCPGGDTSDPKKLGEIFLANKGNGSATRGNYRYIVRGKTKAALSGGIGDIDDYPRLSYHVWELVRRTLNEWKDQR